MTIWTLWRSMQTRSIAKELMDLDTSDPVALKKTVRQFAVINRFFSASRRLIGRFFFSVMEKKRLASCTMLDLGAGGCDIDIWIVKEARKRKIALSVTALDRDDRVLSVAHETIRGYPEIASIKGDVRRLESLGTFDFIFCNHLLHHLTWDEIGRLLASVERQTRIAFLLNDLRRSVWAYAGYSMFASLFLSPSFAYADGRLSIRRGFTENELKALVNSRLPGNAVKIIRTFPARLAFYRCKT